MVDQAESVCTVVVDDESAGRKALRKLCAIVAPHVEIVGEAVSVATAVAVISDLRPELVFLDIKLGDGTGFDVLERLDYTPLVIFVTAFDQFAIQALRQAAVDYLLKPVDPSELKAAIVRVVSRLDERANDRQAVTYRTLVEDIADELASKRMPRRRLAVPDADGYRFVNFEDIVFFSAESNYTLLHVRGGETLVVARTLGDFEDIVPADEFIRIHQSTLVNLAFVRRYVRGKGGYVVLADGRSLDVSSRRKQVLRRFLPGAEDRHKTRPSPNNEASDGH